MSPFCLTRAQYDRWLKACCEIIGLPGVPHDQYPCPTGRVLEEMCTRGLDICERGAWSFVQHNPDLKIDLGEYGSLLWHKSAVDALAETLDRMQHWTPEALARRDANQTAAELLADKINGIRRNTRARRLAPHAN